MRSDGTILDKAKPIAGTTKSMAGTTVAMLYDKIIERLPWQKKLKIGARQWLPITVAGIAFTAIFSRRRHKS